MYRHFENKDAVWNTLPDELIADYEGKYPVLVWDAPGHAASWPFELTFTLMDNARWLDEILRKEGFRNPVIIGQSIGGS